MLNNTLLNTSELNSQLLTEAELYANYDDIVFNGFGLQNDTVITTNIKDSSTPTRELASFKTPRNDGGGIIGDYFRERRIEVTGYIKATTSAELEAKIDEMKRLLTKREGNLDRKISGSVRRLKATISNPDQMFAERQGYHITFCPFTFQFTGYEPMWHDIDYTSNTSYGVTNLDFSEIIENLGTYKVPAVLVLIVEAASNVSKIKFTNNTNDAVIEITTALVAGDILEIDGENKQVLKNGAVIDYDGIFPDMEYGTNSYNIETTGTSIQYTSTLKIKQAYL